jgi:polar amino acid transport system substrate-binding protein
MVFARIAWAVALLAMAAGCAAEDGSLERLRREGVIRIGYAAEAPFAFLSPQGRVTGEAPEVARVVVERLGIGRIEWRQTEFSRLIEELEEGRVDMVAAGMFITRERAERVLFSEPTFRVRQALLVLAGNPLGLHSYGQAAARGARVAVLGGSVEERLLRGLYRSRGDLLVVAPDAVTGLVAVESGQADGLALSSPTVRWMASQDRLGRAEVADPFEQEPGVSDRLGFGAFVFRKNCPALCAACSGELSRFIGSAEHRELVAPFGFTASELPGGMRTGQILAQ